MENEKMKKMVIGRDSYDRFAKNLYSEIRCRTENMDGFPEKQTFLRYMEWYSDEIATGVKHIIIKPNNLYNRLQKKFNITFKMKLIFKMAGICKPGRTFRNFTSCIHCGFSFKTTVKGLCGHCRNLAIKRYFRDEITSWLDELVRKPLQECPFSIINTPEPEDPYPKQAGNDFPALFQKTIKGHLEMLLLLIEQQDWVVKRNPYVRFTYQEKHDRILKALQERGFIEKEKLEDK
jgi:hypothetical protein